MAIRFRKSIKLAPGIRWNISGSGSSWTVGPRGASVGIGKRGAFLNTGIPGTGLSSRSRLVDSSSAQVGSEAALANSVSMTCEILTDGTLSFVDKTGAAVPGHIVETAKKQNRDAILDLIQRKCDEINEQVEALGKLHHHTADARLLPVFIALPFLHQKPVAPQKQTSGFFGSLIPGRRLKVEKANLTADELFHKSSAAWEVKKAESISSDIQRKQLVETLIYEDIAAMEGFLEENLEDIVWPRETIIAFEIFNGGKTVVLDVDLPEIEDMPNKLAAVPARGLKLSIKELTAIKIQKLYAEHIHGLVFRIIGEVFACLPTVQRVIACGYSQRREAATAQLRDEYLISVQVRRLDWCSIDFAHLSNLDVVAVLNQFDLRRDMSKSGLFKAIEPHSAVEIEETAV